MNEKTGQPSAADEENELVSSAAEPSKSTALSAAPSEDAPNAESFITRVKEDGASKDEASPTHEADAGASSSGVAVVEAGAREAGAREEAANEASSDASAGASSEAESASTTSVVDRSDQSSTPANLPADGEDVAADEEAPSSDRPPVAEIQPGISYRVFGRTDVGLVREHNEDNFTIFDLEAKRRGIEGDELWSGSVGSAGFVAAVCDGMGGAAAGEVASHMAVDTIFGEMEAQEPPRDRDEFAARMVHAIETAGAKIFEAARIDRNRRGMGTTATVAGLVDQVLFLGQVGDSRAYLLREGKLTQLTKDQSLVNQLIEAGQLTEEEAEGFEHSNIILQALGTTEEVAVDLTFIELRRGDRVMMCSDGLSGMVHALSIEEVLGDTPDPRMVCARLIEMANVGGGHDNITCIVADFGGEALPPPDATTVGYQQYLLPRASDDTTRAAAKGANDGAPRSIPAPPAAGGGAVTQPAPGVPRWAIGIALVAVALLLLVFKLASPTPPEPPPRTVQPTVIEPIEPRPHVVETVEVELRTNVVGGELFVGESSVGLIEDAEPIFLELAPGDHTLRVVRDGKELASRDIVVEPATPLDVELTVELKDSSQKRGSKKPTTSVTEKPDEPSDEKAPSPDPADEPPPPTDSPSPGSDAPTPS